MKKLLPRMLMLAGTVTGTLVGACGGTSGTGQASGGAPAATTPPTTPPAPTGTSTATPPAPGDHGAPSTTFPAFTPDFPRIQNNGGHLLTTAEIVTVTFADDPNAATFEAIGDSIGASAYWTTITGEYGIGPATSGAADHVRVPTMPTIVLTDPNNDPQTQIETWLVKQLKAPATSGFPPPTDQSLYALYLSGPVAQQFCDASTEGYHASVTFGGKSVTYAVSNLCMGDPPETPLQSATSTASHELAEASLNPLPNATPDGWQGLDANHLAWELMQQSQDENADMCEYYDDIDGAFAEPTLPFFVQRQWSNKSAAAGHAPCVPTGAAAYFNVVPLGATDTVAADFTSLGNNAPFADPVSKGIRLAVGATRTIPVGFYSDRTTDPFTLDVIEAAWTDPNAADAMTATLSPTLTLSLDKTTGVNGEKAFLTITVNRAAPTGVALVLLRSTLGGETHPMPILVGQNATVPAAAASAPRGAAQIAARARVRRRR